MMVFDMSMGILALRHVATVVLCQAGAIEAAAAAAGVLAGYCTVGETLPVGAERRGKSRSGRDVKSHLAISSSIHYIPRSLEL